MKTVNHFIKTKHQLSFQYHNMKYPKDIINRYAVADSMLSATISRLFYSPALMPAKWLTK